MQAKPTNAIYAGIMTGSSLDAADVVLCAMQDNTWQTIKHTSTPIPKPLANTLRQMDDNTAIVDMMEARRDITNLCAHAYQQISDDAHNVIAIGCHGQTILHRPERSWTLQLLDGALLAEQCGVDVICDFRSRDIAAGGQGAPLAPLFHRAVFTKHIPCAIINLGGIANITVLDSDNSVRGWDIGPANMLMDAWMQKHNSESFDRDGAWASGGRVDDSILQQLNVHPFLSLSPPKSCGREEFDLRHFEKTLASISPQDAMMTLLEWSAQNIATTINKENITHAFICGGGARNKTMMSRLQELCTISIVPTDSVGIAAEIVEAAAFAWLARAFMLGESLELPTITGAKGNRILGACYPR